MKTTDSPYDPELVAAVNAIFQRFTTEFADIPKPWKIEQNSSRNSLTKKRATAKRKQLANRDGSRCAYCGAEFYDLSEATLDHVIPYRMVRSWGNWALVLACGPCNNRKADKIPSQLMPLLSAVVYLLAQLHAIPAERSLVLVGGAA